MPISAKLRHLRMSPRKVRLVADVIRGLDVKVAKDQLEFMNKRAAKPLLKLLNSAIANATDNLKLKKDNLFISELKVDEAPTIKRWMPRAFGRASAINKRTSHINIILDTKGEKPETHEIKETKEKDKKKIDKDVKIVKSLDEVKELDKKESRLEEIKETKETKKLDTEHKPEPFDVRREGSDRGKQHLDTVRRKEKGGGLKRFFRRKPLPHYLHK